MRLRLLLKKKNQFLKADKRGEKMENKIKNNLKIDKRIRAVFGEIEFASVTSSPASTREGIMADQESEEAKQGRAILEMVNNASHYKEVVPDRGLLTSTKEFISDPDGNTIKIQYIRPDTEEELPCVYYIHGGGMMVSSCFDELYAAWGRCIARQGVSVAMVDFRNAMWASSAPEVEPYPAGLNDCASATKWVFDNKRELNISSIIISGESGGGNLSIATALKAKKEDWLNQINGVYACCPYISGLYEKKPANLVSLRENDDYLINCDQMAVLAYLYDPNGKNEKNPLAWPYHATEQDLHGLPPHFIWTNELDPLRDDGIAFYRKLLGAGVSVSGQTT